MTSNRADHDRHKKLLPRLRRVAIALLVALGCLTTVTPASTQPAPAAAAPAAPIASLIVTQSGPSEGGTICIGDRVQFEASVRWNLDFLLAGNVTGNSLTGLTVTTFSDNRLGMLSPASAPIRWPHGAASFTFTAERAGVASLVFETDVNQRSIFGIEYGGAHLVMTVPIRVDDCAYRVAVVSRWAVPGEAQLTLRGYIADAGLAYDDTGRLSGTGHVQWSIENGGVGDCIGTVNAANSEVGLVGDVDGDDLILDLDFSSALGTILINCGFGAFPMPVELLPGTLTLVVPAAGGTRTIPHQLLQPEPQTGEALLLITRKAPQ